MAEQMLNDMEFEEQICKLSGDDLNRFVARQMYATNKRCAICVLEFANIKNRIGEFDPEEKGSLDKRLTDIEARDKRHLSISTAAGAGGGVGLAIVWQAFWTWLTSPHKG